MFVHISALLLVFFHDFAFS
uniref:Uncharacterized protein n=1 Tax=Anguilla anguilla TaxID=7936 RepID=A0A0E9VTH9_ANGAN